MEELQPHDRSVTSDTCRITECIQGFALQTISTEAVSEPYTPALELSDAFPGLQCTGNFHNKFDCAVKAAVSVMCEESTPQVTMKALSLTTEDPRVWGEQQKAWDDLCQFVQKNRPALLCELQLHSHFESFSGSAAVTLQSFCALFLKVVAWPNIGELIKDTRATCCVDQQHYSECVEACERLEERILRYLQLQ